MDKRRYSFTLERLGYCLLAVFTVLVTTAILILVGETTPDKPVVFLAYLIPIGWSAFQWGLDAGIAAAIASVLAFDFFFIPPFYTFVIGSPQGWLILFIFGIAAVVLVRQSQRYVARVQAREQEVIVIYELVVSMINMRTHEEIARMLANRIQQLYQAELVNVAVLPVNGSPGFQERAPINAVVERQPDRILPIKSERETLVAEISIWQGRLPLPAEESWLFQSFVRQIGLAFERTQQAEEVRV